MSRFWSPLVNKLTPYVPGEQPKLTSLVKLNTNENPYAPSPKVLQAMQAELADTLRLYPDPNGDHLKATIAKYHGVDKSQVFLGNGSDEVLAHAFAALLQHDAPLLFPDISYSFYPVYCGLFGVDYRQVPLDAEFAICVEDYDQHCGAIIFPNPNAPTAKLLPLAAVESLLQRHPEQVVLVDEAYIDFGGDSAIGLVAHYPNLLVVQTLSKSRSLAGLRVGFAIGHADLIEALERVKNSFNSYPLDRVALVGAAASFGDEAYFQEKCQVIIATREQLSSQMRDLGFEVLPSAANFIFARHPQHDAAQLAAALRKHSIIVRHFNQDRIEQFLRISIGTDAECKLLVDALHKLLSV
jgi:histidinol-phosphate aminotransferase